MLQNLSFFWQIIALEDEEYTIRWESDVVKMLDSAGNCVNDVVELKLAPYKIASSANGSPDSLLQAAERPNEGIVVASV